MTGSPSRSQRQEHLWERATREIAEWIDETVPVLVDALKIGSRTPFGARVSRTERLEYFRSMLYNPDGSPNMEGRQMLTKTYGIDGFAKALTAVVRAQRRGVLGAIEGDTEDPALEPPDVEPAEFIRRALASQ